MVEVVIVVEVEVMLIVVMMVEVVEVMVVVLWCHLLLHLLAGLQALVPSQQPQLVQLVALHLTRQEEVEGEGQVLSVPGARHLHIVLWLHPEGVDLNTHTQSEGVESEQSGCVAAPSGHWCWCLTSAGVSFSSMSEMKARLSAPSLAERSKSALNFCKFKDKKEKAAMKTARAPPAGGSTFSLDPASSDSVSRVGGFVPPTHTQTHTHHSECVSFRGENM